MFNNLETFLGDISANSIEKAVVLKKAKELLPHILYDAIPFEFDTENNPTNLDTAISLSSWQKDIIYNLNPRETPINIAHLVNGAGKASSHTSKVWTPEGYKLMGDIQPGDFVLTPDGQSVEVLAKYPQGKVSIYKVSFSDGSSTEVTEDHLWEVSYNSGGSFISKVKSTKDIKDNLTINRGRGWRYSIPLVQDTDFITRELTIDPYLLGLLIGDGCFRHTSGIRFTNIEEDIISYVESHGFRKVSSTKYDYHKYGKEFRKLIQDYNLLDTLLGDRFIPKDYLYNTREVRLSVLQGLMDTEGSICIENTYNNRKDDGRSIEFCSKSKQLCEDVKFLVLSLGGLASQPTLRTTYCDEFELYRIHIQVPDSLNIFRTSRKSDLFNKTSSRMSKRFITSIEEIRKDEASCISIDHPRHLYLVDDLICTHNTYLIGLCLTLMLLDDHPSLSPGLMGVKGDIWLLTNSSLLKTEYPSNFLRSPGWLGKESDFNLDQRDKDGNITCPKGYNDVIDSKGNLHRIRLLKDSSGALSGFKNETNGKAIKFWSYSVNEQKLAGQNPISIFCDEFGDKTTTSGATGANRFTKEKLYEMAVRCGRNHIVGDNWVFCMFFTLTLGEVWVEDMLDRIRNKEWYMPRLAATRKLPSDHNFAKLIQSQSTIESNPSINRSTIEAALDWAENLGDGDYMSRRLIAPDGDDPLLVFPKSTRPNKLTTGEVQDIIKRAETEAGWLFVQSIDPGWNDKCSVLFSLCHPLHGVYILHEFYESRKTVHQVANAVHFLEKEFFRNQKLHLRIFDPNHIRKTTQESPQANYLVWKNAGLPGTPCHWCKGSRDYDRMIELLIKGVVHYSPAHCKGLDRELRTHKKNLYGIPEERANNHSIDAMRYLCNWFYEDYGKKIHLANPTPPEELSEGQRIYQAQLAYYNMIMKDNSNKVKGEKNRIMGCTINPLNLKNVKSFKNK